jgi:hypothetical protein
MEEMCSLAWKFLQQRIAQPSLPLQQKSLPGKLMVRGSLLVDEFTPN